MNRNMLKRNPVNVTPADIETVQQIRKLLLGILSIPAATLEHAVQTAHATPDDPEEADRPMKDWPEVFEEQGVTRQTLRMFLNFRGQLSTAIYGRGK